MGRPQWERVVAEAPREEIQIYDYMQNVSVAVNGSFQVDLFAPAGYIGELNSMWLHAEAPSGYGGATSGTHVFGLRDTEEEVYYTQAAQQYNGVLDFQQNIWATYYNCNPTTEVGIILTFQSIKFDNTIGLRIKYFNLLNAAITNSPLKIRLIYKLKQVAGVGN